MMKLTTYRYLNILLAWLVTISVFTSFQAQTSKMKYAEKLFDALKYKEASEEYKKVYERGNANRQLFEHLGDSYYYNTDMRNANKWYKKLFETYENNSDINPEYYFRYAHSLQGVGKNDEAKKWMKRFSKHTKFKDSRKSNYIQASNELDAVLNTKSNYKLKNVSINTEYSDFGVAYYGDDVVYASSKTKSKNSEKYKWNNQPFLNVFKAPFDLEDLDTDYEEDKLFSKQINTDYHESNAVFNKELTKVYFTRNNFDKKLGDDGNGVSHLKLYSADLDEDTFKLETHWKNIQELPFNSDQYSVGHPALSPDGKQLFFTSDMPGSIGATDIFVVDILGDNEYSAPKNLGSKINTSGREMFPFVVNNKLYFASDGHLGFGGLDVFKSNILDEIYQNPTNMGKPVNSSKDDFAFVLNDKFKSGFLSSNRKGGKGDDDIYAIIPVEGEVCNQGMNGLVTNVVTGERITNASLVLYDELGSKMEETTSNEIGKYRFKTILDCNSKYEIKVSKQGYKSIVSPSITEAVSGSTYLPLRIETLDKLIVEEKGVLKLKIGIIYFDLDKDFIRNDAAIELNKIVMVMSQYPKMHIKIESHTDSRSPDDYNMDLSDRRAKNTRDYIVSKGIDVARINSAIGYGETQLINRCVNGNTCSEAEHQLNRRSEFIIVKM